MTQQQPSRSTRLPDYWTHLDGTPCLSEYRWVDGTRERGLQSQPDGAKGRMICDDHDRITRPPTGRAD